MQHCPSLLHIGTNQKSRPSIRSQSVLRSSDTINTLVYNRSNSQAIEPNNIECQTNGHIRSWPLSWLLLDFLHNIAARDRDTYLFCNEHIILTGN